ncbi:MAG: nitroreductase [Eubacterium sp.]|nr:nitroreductase [Eubacterium sp.]MBQ9229536.1 nitroreductase [Eubacterium sp.]
MDIYEAVKVRHSVRQYLDKPLEADVKEKLEALVAQYNAESGLHIQLVSNEPKAFSSKLASYGNFQNVSNYFVLVGKKRKKLDELCGYYGEKLVLDAQMLGLNTCWVALTYKKIPEAFQIEKDEKLTVVIALGYGETQGKERKTKDGEAVCDDMQSMPKWFQRGVRYALMAPTATNQQKFKFELIDNYKVKAKTVGIGPELKVDLGIVKYHFEIGAGVDNFEWV